MVSNLFLDSITANVISQGDRDLNYALGWRRQKIKVLFSVLNQQLVKELEN